MNVSFFIVFVMFYTDSVMTKRGRVVPPKFIDRLGDHVDVKAEPGRNVKLLCKTKSKPNAFVVWSKNTKEIVKSQKYAVYRHYLVIKSVKPEDAGNYVCDVKNPHGFVRRTFTVTLPGNTDNSNGMSKAMQEMKTQLEQLKTQVANLTSTGVHLHVYNGQDEKDSYIHQTGSSVNSSHGHPYNEQHVHMYMHVKSDRCDEDEHEDEGHEETHGHCEIQANSNIVDGDDIRGQIHFIQKENDHVDIFINLRGFDMTKKNAKKTHGFHIHEVGDMSNSCDSLGAHFNPHGTTHGAKDHHKRHAGDLGNIECDVNGEVDKQMVDDRISLRGKYSLFGRSITIHAGADDLGLGGTDSSLAGGDAGPRIACCIIARADPSKNKHHSHHTTTVSP